MRVSQGDQEPAAPDWSRKDCSRIAAYMIFFQCQMPHDDLSAGNNERLVTAAEAQYVDLVASDIEVRSLLITLSL